MLAGSFPSSRQLKNTFPSGRTMATTPRPRFSICRCAFTALTTINTRKQMVIHRLIRVSVASNSSGAPALPLCSNRTHPPIYLHPHMPLVLVKSDPRAREKPCLRCGYSLRKILDARNCPECGLSVWVSLNQNDSLDWSRPEWLRQIALGAFIMAAAQVLGIFMAVLIVAQEIFGWFVTAWVVAVYLLALNTGMILLSIPERRYPDKWKGYRWFVLI